MILPETVSAREVYLPEPPIVHTLIPRGTPISLSETNEEQGSRPLPPSPIHTFNEMPSLYQNLVSRQVPNVGTNPDPLADIKRREREIEKERDYREHELRMEYEKRLEEFEADYRIKEQELEKEKLSQEKRLIAEREREIDADRKRMLEEAFGTDQVDLGASEYGEEEQDAIYGDVEDNWSDDSYLFESGENSEEVH